MSDGMTPTERAPSDDQAAVSEPSGRTQPVGNGSAHLDHAGLGEPPSAMELAREESQPDPAEERARRKQVRRNQAAIELLRSWREEGDEQDHRQTMQVLRQALGKDRASGRKLFP